jgi:hypothetical protein
MNGFHLVCSFGNSIQTVLDFESLLPSAFDLARPELFPTAFIGDIVPASSTSPFYCDVSVSASLHLGRMMTQLGAFIRFQDYRLPVFYLASTSRINKPIRMPRGCLAFAASLPDECVGLNGVRLAAARSPCTRSVTLGAGGFEVQRLMVFARMRYNAMGNAEVYHGWIRLTTRARILLQPGGRWMYRRKGAGSSC